MNIDFAHRILNALDNGIIIIDKNLEVLFWNTWLELHTKIKEADILGKNIVDFFPSLKTTSLKRKIKTALALNSPSFYSSQTSEPLFEIQRPHISNTIFHTMKQDITISPYNIDLGLVCINIVDQTPLFEANYKLSSTADFKSDFLANMSHEIRTPMNAILGFVEQLAKTETQPSRKEQFTIIKRSSHSLLTIINDILDLSKIESGEFELNLRTCDIVQVFEETTLLYKDLAKQKNISLQFDVQADIPAYFILDVMRTKQIVFNLLSNAIKFTPEGGKVTLSVNFEPLNKVLTVEVRDTGIGIAEHNLTKIFKAFKQEESSTSEHFGGTGLGLSISSKLIKLMCGEFHVTSELSQGSCFSFEIPVNTSKEPPEETSLQDNEQETSFHHLKALVVEDNKTNQILMGLILDELCISYELANNGLEAVEMAQNKVYDFILMDDNMPFMNGRDACVKIREYEVKQSSKKIPIIAVTANALPEERKHFFTAGMDDVITKPYTEQDIKNMLLKHLH